MLTGDFFELVSVHDTAGKLSAVVRFNASHAIFEGHFPGQPVVPGVCMMQLVKEVLRPVFGQDTRLEKADLVKFLTVINPVETGAVNVEVTYAAVENDRVKITATLFAADLVYFKMRGTFLVSIDHTHPAQ